MSVTFTVIFSAHFQNIHTSFGPQSSDTGQMLVVHSHFAMWHSQTLQSWKSDLFSV